MQAHRPSKRWLVVLGSMLIQLSLGTIYAWSVFTPALKAAGWTKVDTQIVFAVSLVTFALVMVFAGRGLAKLGPRKLVAAGGVALGAGYVFAGLFGGTEFWAVCLGVGLIGGAGIGLAYVVPIAVGIRWFPDKKGLITGLAVAGFGFGAMGWVKLAGAWGDLIGLYGLSTTFVIYGGAFAALILLGSVWMVMPPQGWKPEGLAETTPAAAKGLQNFTVQEMLRTPQFYLIFLTFAVSAGAGLMSIGLMKLYPMEALQAAGYSAVEASAIAGTAMAVFFSLANGVGRIVWGTLSDKIGRRRSVATLTAIQAIALLSFTGMAGNEYLLYFGAMLIGLPKLSIHFSVLWRRRNCGTVVGGDSGRYGQLPVGVFHLRFCLSGRFCQYHAGQETRPRRGSSSGQRPRLRAPDAPRPSWRRRGLCRAPGPFQTGCGTLGSGTELSIRLAGANFRQS